jgi:hypothetical protein
MPPEWKMQTSSFNRELLPPAAAFYAREFGSALSRRRPDRKGYVTVPCCFHQSSKPKSRPLAINMREGNFYCFSCGEKGGDVLSFLMKRDNLDFKRAAQSLGAWLQNPTPADRRELEAKQRERERTRATEEARKENERQERIAVRDSLHTIEALYRKAIGEHDFELMPRLYDCVTELDKRYCELAGLSE